MMKKLDYKLNQLKNHNREVTDMAIFVFKILKINQRLDAGRGNAPGVCYGPLTIQALLF